MVAIDEILKNADFLTRLEETVKMDAELKFYSKHPELALLRQNLLQVDSVYEQVRFYHVYSAIPDRSGPGFIGFKN